MLGIGWGSLGRLDGLEDLLLVVLVFVGWLVGQPREFERKCAWIGTVAALPPVLSLTVSLQGVWDLLAALLEFSLLEVDFLVWMLMLFDSVQGIYFDF